MVLKVKGDSVNLLIKLLKVGKDLVGHGHQRLLPWQPVVHRVVDALESVLNGADDVVVQPSPNAEDRTADEKRTGNRPE